MLIGEGKIPSLLGLGNAIRRTRAMQCDLIGAANDTVMSIRTALRKLEGNLRLAGRPPLNFAPARTVARRAR